MTKNHSTKKVLIASIVSFVLCLSMLVGTTFAWFTDSASSGSNVIQSGKLDIVLEYWDGDSWEDAEGKVIPFVAADGRSQDEILWEPGCTYEMAPFRVRNEGNLNANILILLNGIAGDEKLMDVIELKTGINNIPDSLMNGSASNVFQRFEDAEFDIIYGAAEGNIIFDHSLAGKGQITPGTGHTDTSPEFTIIGRMAADANNEYQDLSIDGISITVLATQQSYETDSFNKYYDKNAPLPKVDYAYIGENSSETKIGSSNVVLTVPAGVPEGGYQLQVSNESTTTDEDGLITFSLDINLLKDGVKVQENSQDVYRVEINIGKDMQISKILHNGVEITSFSYSPDTGILSFETASFSPFEIVYAKVPAGAHKVIAGGKTKYFTDINEAIAQASGETEIILGSNITLEDTLIFDKDAIISLDMNGFSISGKLKTLVKISDGTLNVKNGSFTNVHEAATNTKYNIYMCGDATASFDNVEIVTSGVGIMMTESSKITKLCASIDSFMNANGTSPESSPCYDAISLTDSARIDEIVGGNYTTRYTEQYVKDWKEKPDANGQRKVVEIISWTVNINGESASIGTISGGTFLGVMDKANNGSPIHVESGKIELISGGYFGFVKYGLSNPIRSMYIGANGSIDKITGGTFEKGSLSTGFGCSFESIVNTSDCKVENTETTVEVNIQFSTKITKYTLNVVTVVAK